MGAARYTRGTLLRELALIAAAAFYCLPFFMLVAIALETTEQAYKSPLSPHWPPHCRQLLGGLEHRRTGGARPRAAEQPDHHALERRRPDRARLALRLHDRPAPGPAQQPRVSGVRARHHPAVPARDHPALRRDAPRRPGRQLPRDDRAQHRAADAVDGLPLHRLHPRLCPGTTRRRRASTAPGSCGRT